ncbi:hypothetical protein [Angustibacter luteus]|uniref:DUF4062 domain-containing protein n=1 Tax=Angustibacter luteus TaxID=658456 RepID=A0ABW1JIC1_9ACTN
MSYAATVLTVMISSPGDCASERRVIEDQIRAWNSLHSTTSGTILRPWRWELDSAAILGEPAQDAINAQAALCDIVVAVFHSRLGTPTKEHESGTAEEVLLGLSARKPTHIYFSEASHPGDVAEGQLKALRKFRKRVDKMGLNGTFSSPEGLGYHVQQALVLDVEKLTRARTDSPTRSAAADTADPSPCAEEIVQEAILEKLALGRHVFFGFRSNSPADDIGILEVKNSSAGGIRSFVVLEGKVIDGNSYVCSFAPSEHQDYAREIGVGNMIQVIGNWYRYVDGERQPFIMTPELNSRAQVEAYWMDALGGLWSTDNRGGIPQLVGPTR